MAFFKPAFVKVRDNLIKGVVNKSLIIMDRYVEDYPAMN